MILNFSEITPFIEFLKKYFCSIITILRDNINDLSYNYKLSNFGTKLENFQVYSSTLIGLRDGARWELAIGDEIFIKKADGEISYSKIEEIRTYEATSDISIKINGNVKKNSLIYKYNKKDELSIGAKAESYISLTIPTKCNAEGALDVDGYFSGVKLEFWFRATLHADETSSEPNYNKKIIDELVGTNYYN